MSCKEDDFDDREDQADRTQGDPYWSNSADKSQFKSSNGKSRDKNVHSCSNMDSVVNIAIIFPEIVVIRIYGYQYAD